MLDQPHAPHRHRTEPTNASTTGSLGPAVRTHHRRSAVGRARRRSGTPRARCACATRGRSARLVRWRIPGVSDGQTFTELFRNYPFTLLERGRRLVGLRAVRADLDARARLPAARPARRTSARGTSPAPCACCSRTGPSRPSDGRATLVSEARVEPVDPTARMRLRALWTVIGPFEPLVGAEPLTVAAAAGRAARSGDVRRRRSSPASDDSPREHRPPPRGRTSTAQPPGQVLARARPRALAAGRARAPAGRPARPPASPSISTRVAGPSARAPASRPSPDRRGHARERRRRGAARRSPSAHDHRGRRAAHGPERDRARRRTPRTRRRPGSPGPGPTTSAR